ncbi:MAG: GGDEF domain-containing protein [Gammaproteobacteria bacterium]|nr:GGDEF domain-containing protein [Gammaproteobacteria bacterium]NIR83838.1 GGDEF domain-containing protein [Gammaproteobacteria bacterium]NIR88342.1 GGDEF domain-containing protein [Gammaproteobacteria bacterium]NIU05161.1 GGDEF domain-containing protein [Gammaproteobacteria bacterium]NIV51991.1 diguanylate cyclase [Gammaproteobacteria bacterium]
MHADVSYRNALSVLLDALQTPAELARQAGSIRERLAERAPGAPPQSAVDDLADLIVQVRCHTEEERQSWDALLERFGERLGTVHEQVRNTLQRLSVAHEVERGIESTLERHVDELRWRLAAVGNPGQMRSIIRDQMTMMRNRLDDRKSKETLHYALFQRQLNELAEALRAMVEDLGQLRTQVAEEQVQALRDPVTGIANRLAYEQRLHQEYARWKRYGSPLALLLLEVDDAKELADGYGPRVAEKALRLVAGILRENLREADFIARHANETFAVLMPETCLEGTPAVAERLREVIARRAFHYQGTPVAITLSVGAAELQPEDTTPRQVFERAQRALAMTRGVPLSE